MAATAPWDLSWYVQLLSLGCEFSKRNNMLSLRTHHWLLIKRFESFSIHYQHMNRI
ncbi:hypothetical protein F2Q69_00001305 [Brassica cretica]|uniref:Uncharacterized protein n=1 Tax=Brassica cretica TaxID=69181 RepID=A0A8S9P4G2_BRACR|nr:hypothetical protein F2Q69_00001305 [Brassica cretica]